MVGRRICKLARAARLFPAPGAEFLRRSGAKPLLLRRGVIMQPLQALALVAACNAFTRIRSHQMHVGFKSSNDRHAHLLADTTLDRQADVAQIANDPLRQPIKTSTAFHQARVKKENLSTIGRNGPRAQGNQKLRVLMVRKPEPKGVLLITDEVSGPSRLYRAPAKGGPPCGEAATGLFLYSLVAAGRSVASMIATPCCCFGHVAKMRCKRTAFKARKTRGVSRSRNSCNCRVLGNLRKFGNRAKRLHARCSGKSSQSRLVERAGVSNSNNSTRNNCTELHSARRPPPRRGSMARISESGT